MSYRGAKGMGCIGAALGRTVRTCNIYFNKKFGKSGPKGIFR
jgi:hypothetical protein